MRKLKIEETKATGIIKRAYFFLISNFFLNKIALAIIWMSLSCSNLALEGLNFHKMFSDFLFFLICTKMMINQARSSDK